MQSKYKAKKQQITDQEKSLPEIESIVRTFDHCCLKVTENIFSFWERNKGTYPVLYELATIILPVPGTEVRVERLFSQLRFILHPLRNGLADDVINDILILKANFKNFLNDI